MLLVIILIVLGVSIVVYLSSTYLLPQPVVTMSPPPTTTKSTFQPQYTIIQSKGICHGLPVFPESLTGLSAIVAGSNGVSGDHMMRVLNDSPHRWANIYSLSRKPPSLNRQWRTNVRHIPLDFLKNSPEELAKALRDNKVKADYIFFFAYMQVQPNDQDDRLWSDAERMTQTNSTLLSRFLDALKIARITPKRFMLQTGAKTYGLHLGPALTPQHEKDPRILFESNFYYEQEDLLFKYCRETGAKWNVVRPSHILGAVKESAMNLAYPLGVFAAVQAYLGNPMVYPGDQTAFQTPVELSTAKMNGHLEEWAVLTPGAENEAFSACDCSAFTFGKFWPILASWYGASYEVPSEKTEYKSIPMPYEPPPKGHGPRGVLRFSSLLVEWASDPKVHQAWKVLAERYDLQSDPFTNESDRMRIFGFADTALLMSWPLQYNMDKSHRLGWHGTVDSIESIKSVLQEFVELEMLPPFPQSTSKSRL